MDQWFSILSVYWNHPKNFKSFGHQVPHQDTRDSPVIGAQVILTHWNGEMVPTDWINAIQDSGLLRGKITEISDTALTFEPDATIGG